MSAGNEGDFIDYLEAKERGGKTMQCPLFVIGILAKSGSCQGATYDCLKEKCAWWDQVHGTCGELTKANALWHIKEVLCNIAKELTMVRPPAK